MPNCLIKIKNSFRRRFTIKKSTLRIVFLTLLTQYGIVQFRKRIKARPWSISDEDDLNSDELSLGVLLIPWLIIRKVVGLTWGWLWQQIKKSIAYSFRLVFKREEIENEKKAKEANAKAKRLQDELDEAIKNGTDTKEMFEAANSAKDAANKANSKLKAAKKKVTIAAAMAAANTTGITDKSVRDENEKAAENKQEPKKLKKKRKKSRSTAANMASHV